MMMATSVHLLPNLNLTTVGSIFFLFLLLQQMSFSISNFVIAVKLYRTKYITRPKILISENRGAPVFCQNLNFILDCIDQCCHSSRQISF